VREWRRKSGPLNLLYDFARLVLTFVEFLTPKVKECSLRTQLFVNFFFRVAVKGITRLKFNRESLLVCIVGIVDFDDLIDVETVV
jgi:hypothetical protein